MNMIENLKLSNEMLRNIMKDLFNKFALLESHLVCKIQILTLLLSQLSLYEYYAFNNPFHFIFLQLLIIIYNWTIGFEFKLIFSHY